MKTLNLLSPTAPLFAIVVLLSLDTYAQDLTSNKDLWVTIENEAAVPHMKDGKLVSADAEVQKMISDYSITSVEQAIPASRQVELQKVYEVKCFCNEDALAEAMIKSNAFSNPEAAPEYELFSTPNDYSLTFNEDYALDLINASEAWDYSTGDAGTIVGISDGSFYTNHEELQNQYTSVTNNQYAPVQYYYHGTAVATTAAGATDNASGKSSIGYNCSMALNTVGYNQLLQLTYDGAKVINASWGSGCSYNSYCQAIINEVHNFGTIIVASAGNGGTCGGPTALVYPAAYDNVIAVSSVGPKDNHERTVGNPSTTHQHNSSVDICAPGYDVALTVAPGWYFTGNGTSFAAPYVSGTIGLMLSANPCLTSDDVLFILQETAVNIDAQNPSYIGTLGAGRLDAGAAVKYAANLSCSENPGQGNGNNGNGGVGTTNPTVGQGNNSGNVGVNGQGGPRVTNSEGTEISEGRYAAEETNEDTTIDKEALFQASVYPNPSRGTTTIKWNKYSEGMTMMIFDSESNLVVTKEITTSENSTQVEMPVSGVYYVRLIQNGQQVWMGKFIKL